MDWLASFIKGGRSIVTAMGWEPNTPIAQSAYYNQGLIANYILATPDYDYIEVITSADTIQHYQNVYPNGGPVPFVTTGAPGVLADNYPTGQGC